MTNKGSRYRIAAFFDLDCTITDLDSFHYFLAVYHLSRLKKWPYIPWLLFYGILRKLRFISLQTFKEKALVSLIGLNPKSIQQVGKAFIEKHLSNTFRKLALERINRHRELGHYTFIITSCPDVYLFSLAEYLKCDGYDGSRLVYRGNKFIGKIAGNDCFGAEKTLRVQVVVENKAIDLSQSYAYSDHESDLPILEMVGKPVAVTPTDQLRQIARDRSWKIEEW